MDFPPPHTKYIIIYESIDGKSILYWDPLINYMLVKILELKGDIEGPKILQYFNPYFLRIERSPSRAQSWG
jgi:hypothetical protein